MAVQTKCAELNVNAIWSPHLESDEVWVLWDSGSDEHLCSSNLAAFGQRVNNPAQPMIDVQGSLILDTGAANVPFKLTDYDENDHNTNVEFRISDVNDHIMSAGKVINRNTFRAILDADGSYLQRKDDESICVPIYMRRNSFYLKAKVGHGVQAKVRTVTPSQVAPLGQGEMLLEDLAAPIIEENADEIVDEMPNMVVEQPSFPLLLPGRESNPAGIHPGSSVDIMRAWLKEKKAAIYGTKTQLYERIL
jgi:hypothetical protein